MPTDKSSPDGRDPLVARLLPLRSFPVLGKEELARLRRFLRTHRAIPSEREQRQWLSDIVYFNERLPPANPTSSRGEPSPRLPNEQAIVLREIYEWLYVARLQVEPYEAEGETSRTARDAWTKLESLKRNSTDKSELMQATQEAALAYDRAARDAEVFGARIAYLTEQILKISLRRIIADVPAEIRILKERGLLGIDPTCKSGMSSAWILPNGVRLSIFGVVWAEARGLRALEVYVYDGEAVASNRGSWGSADANLRLTKEGLSLAEALFPQPAADQSDESSSEPIAEPPESGIRHAVEETHVPSRWQPPKGYVGSKTILSHERFRKGGKNPSRSTLQEWENRSNSSEDQVQRVVAPDSGEVFFPEAWVQDQMKRWHPRVDRPQSDRKP